MTNEDAGGTEVPSYSELWEIYFKRKLAKYKTKGDKFTSREKRLMRVAFRAGYGWREHKERIAAELRRLRRTGVFMSDQ